MKTITINNGVYIVLPLREVAGKQRHCDSLRYGTIAHALRFETYKAYKCTPVPWLPLIKVLTSQDLKQEAKKVIEAYELPK